MKKLYLVLIATLVYGWSYAQEIQHIASQFAESIRDNSEEPVPSLRGGDDPFWYNDFSDATTWDAESVIGNYNWEITSSTTGWFFNGAINSNSGGDYAFVWNGDATDPNETLLQSQYYLTTAQAIDVSTIESAVLEFQLYGARFTDSLKVQVSNNGTDFTTVGNHQDVEQLTAGGGSQTANPITRSYNVTLDVEGQNELWIRFNFETATSGIAYGWFIDDVSLIIPEDYDLTLSNVYTGDIINDYEYTITPIDQVHPINLGGEITNLGGLEAVNARISAEVFLDGGATPVYTGMSDPVNIVQGETEQLWIFTDYVPAEVGTYTVEYEAIQDEADAIPEDNVNDKEFLIDPYYFGNDDYNDLSADFDGALGDVTTADEWLMGSSFTIFEDGYNFEAASVSFANGTVAGSEVAMTLWLIGDNGLEFLTSTEYTVEQDDISGSNFTVIATDDPEPLEVGNTYVVAIQHLGGEGALVIDCSEFDNDFSTFIYGAYGVGGGVDWFVFDDLSPAIRMSIDSYVGVEENNLTNLSVGQNYPNPISGVTTIPYSLKEATKMAFEITDMLGKVVYSEDLGTVSKGSKTLEINDLNIPTGVYTYSFVSEEFKISKLLTSN